MISGMQFMFMFMFKCENRVGMKLGAKCKWLDFCIEI